MIHKRRTRKLTLVFITTLIVIGLAILYYLRDISNTYYFVNLKTPNCELLSSSPECKLNVIHAQTVTGDDVYFYYNKADLIIENKTGRLSGFNPDEKIQVTFVNKDKPKNTDDEYFISKIRAIK